jgi:hypothetical protein
MKDPFKWKNISVLLNLGDLFNEFLDLSCDEDSISLHGIPTTQQNNNASEAKTILRCNLTLHKISIHIYKVLLTITMYFEVIVSRPRVVKR